jgi:lysophospholipase L1-like esterase
MDYESARGHVARTRKELEGGCNVTIVAFGDSITAGYAVRRGFPSFWKEALEKKYPEASIAMVNSGASGDTTLDGRARLPWDVLFYHPDLVTINFGINDAVMELPLKEFRVNLKEIAEAVKAEGTEVLLLSSPPLETPYYDKLVLNYYQIVDEVAKELDVGFLDVYGTLMERVKVGTSLGSLILPGLDHPNEAGYRIIADELMKLF